MSVGRAPVSTASILPSRVLSTPLQLEHLRPPRLAGFTSEVKPPGPLGRLPARVCGAADAVESTANTKCDRTPWRGLVVTPRRPRHVIGMPKRSSRVGAERMIQLSAFKEATPLPPPHSDYRLVCELPSQAS